ncbi:hypothetical protein D3C76_1097670 [compost metagenome]
MLGFIHLQSGDHPVGDSAVVVDKSNRPHGAPHPQGGNELITCRPCAVDSHFRQTVIPAGERDVLGSAEPVAHKILTHGQAQPADHDQAQPPIVENDRTGNDVLMIAVPVHHNAKYQGR